MYWQVVRCECKAEEDRINRERLLLRSCELPQGSVEYTFENFERYAGIEEAYDVALKLAEGSEDLLWLTLQGDYDCGKTHLLIAICRSWLARGRPARYAMAPVLLDELRAGFHPRNEDMSYQERFDFFKNVPLLAIDDLGAESPTSWAREKMDTLFDWRHFHRLPLVVTTNLGLKELGGRIHSRLQRFVPSKVVTLKVGEYRLRRKGAKKCGRN